MPWKNSKPATWRVGLSPYQNMHPECLHLQSTCDPGMELILLSIIAKLFNAKLKFIETKKLGCGQLENGTWTGLMGLLESGAIDITANFCWLTQVRLNQSFISHTFPVFQDRQHYLIKVPRSSYGFEIHAPFQVNVWLTVTFFSTLFLITTCLIFKLYYSIPPVKKSVITLVAEILEIVIDIEKENSCGFQLVCLCWVGFVSFFLLLYSTKITAVLLTPVSIEKPFRNGLDLAEKIDSGEYKFIHYQYPRPACYGMTCELFENGISKYGWHKQAAKTIEDIHAFLNEMLKFNNLVFAMDKNLVASYFRKFPESSKFWLIEDKISGGNWYTYLVHSDFYLKRYFDHALILVGDFKMNLFQRQLKYFSNVHQENIIKSETSTQQSISLNQIYGPVILIIVGWIVAIIIFVIEIVARYCMYLL